MGYRAIRIGLDKTEILKTQLRALLRASAYGQIRIMYPMIISIEEITRAASILKESKEERREGKAFAEDVQVGGYDRDTCGCDDGTRAGPESGLFQHRYK